MDKDRIINEIVSEVLQQLMNSDNMVNSNTIVDLCKPNEKILSNNEYQVYVIGKLPYQYDTKNLKCTTITQGYHKGDTILITSLSPYMLSNIANGQASNYEEECILYNLLHGYDVYLLEDGLEYQSCRRTAFKALYNLYRDYDDKVRNYGIKVIHEPVEILQQICKTNLERDTKKYYDAEGREGNRKDQLINDNTNNSSFIGKIDWRKRHLLLEKDFVNSRIGVDRIVILSKGCIITPMARDYIREHQIHIELC